MCRRHTQHCVNLSSTRKTLLLHTAAGRRESFIQGQDFGELDMSLAE